MNVKNLIAAFTAIAVTTSAMAQEFVQPDAGFVSTKSRAEVIAELNAAGGNTSLQLADSTYPVIEFEPARSRDEVVAELNEARQDGTLTTSEHEYPLVTASGTSKTRDQVRAELAEYIVSGASQLPSNP